MYNTEETRFTLDFIQWLPLFRRVGVCYPIKLAELVCIYDSSMFSVLCTHIHMHLAVGAEVDFGVAAACQFATAPEVPSQNLPIKQRNIVVC